jgi:hypothetical protein
VQKDPSASKSVVTQVNTKNGKAPNGTLLKYLDDIKKNGNK